MSQNAREQEFWRQFDLIESQLEKWSKDRLVLLTRLQIEEPAMYEKVMEKLYPFTEF